MRSNYHIRKASMSDADHIARLIDISSGGVARIEWKEKAEKEDCDPIEIGERNYRSDQGNYSWRNAIIAEKNGVVTGMLLAFPMPPEPKRDPAKRPTSNAADIYAPYVYLEEPDSWYICGIAIYDRFRGQGLGTRLMEKTHQQARNNGFNKVSLAAFEENEASVRLYQRLGYRIVDHAPIVPHPMIHYSGNALLMVAELD